jgi:hypothetical protein
MLGKCDGFRNIHNEVMRDGQCLEWLKGTRQSVKSCLAQVEPVSRFTNLIWACLPHSSTVLNYSNANFKYNALLPR